MASVREFDPFNVMGIKMTDDRRFERFGVLPATEMQVAALRNLGVAESELNALSKAAASTLFDHLKVRRKRGLCTYKQLVTLRKYGIHDPKVKFDRANAAITYIASCGWGQSRPVDPRQLMEILNHHREPGDS